MAQQTAKHFTVSKNGKLTNRVQAIIDHYRALGVNVELVLEKELSRLNDKLVVSHILRPEEDETGTISEKFNLEPASYLSAKIQAIKEILEVLNS